MKLPPDVTFHEAHGLFVWKPRGILNEATINKITAFVGEQEATFGKPFNRFTDVSSVDSVDLNFKFIFHVALFRRLSYAGRPPVKSAILVSSLTLAHYSKLHEVLTRGSSIEVRVFEDREAAAKWLGVPVELLIISSIGS
jgi:hypothetical protein